MLHDYLNNTPTPTTADDPDVWFEFIGQMRAIQGNISNDSSVSSAVKCLKDYIVSHS
jgi:hypothetical protein